MNIQASIRALLQNKAKETRRPFAEILQYFGMERFLYRVSQSPYARQFILKGALMFTAWNIPERRTTLDIDFLAHFDNQIGSIEKVIRDLCNVTVASDGLVFDAETVRGQRIKEDADYEGVHVKLTGFLGRARIPMQIDIAFNDVVYPRAEMLNFPVILDLPHPRLKGYPPESILSEKFEAMVKLGLLNSRMKDFYDVWMMTRQFDFNGLDLVESLKRTFKHRKTELPWKQPLFAEEIYDQQSDRQTLWAAFLRKGEIRPAPDKLTLAVKAIEKFLIKPLHAIHEDLKFTQTWKAAGTWKES
ncbi:MAG: nucleotidyl transferase AbiEii/AbiGii toxin family protein [Deltaproteobacteria bacterium]